MQYSRPVVERCVKYAYEYTRRRNSKKKMLTLVSIVRTSAIFPSPNRIRKTADNRSYVNYIHLTRARLNSPYARGKTSPLFVRAGVGIGLSLAPLSGRLSVTTRGWAGQRSRPRRGRPCPKARLRLRRSRVGARRDGAGLRCEFRGGPEILRMASGFVIAARIFMRPWHFGHVSASVMNTRFKRRAQGSRLPLCILVISISRDSPVPALSAPALSTPTTSGAGCAGGVGTTLARSLAAGPMMPWYRTRWQRGRGISGINFSISSYGVKTIWVVPSETTGQYT